MSTMSVDVFVSDGVTLVMLLYQTWTNERTNKGGRRLKYIYKRKYRWNWLRNDVALSPFIHANIRPYSVQRVKCDHSSHKNALDIRSACILLFCQIFIGLFCTKCWYLVLKYTWHNALSIFPEHLRIVWLRWHQEWFISSSLTSAISLVMRTVIILIMIIKLLLLLFSLLLLLMMTQ